MSDVKPELFSNGCDHQLPSWGVTRQFDFGQFVVLYDERTVAGKRVVTPIVLSEEGDIVLPEPVGGVAKNAASQPVTTITGGVPLQLLYEAEDAVELVTSQDPKVVRVDSVADFLRNGTVTVADTIYSASLSFDTKLRLTAALPVTVLGRATSAREGEREQEEKRTLIRFVPSVHDEDLTENEVDELLASGEISVGGKTIKDLPTHAVRALLDGEEVIVAAEGADTDPELVRLHPEAHTARPASTHYRISDLAAFVAAPAVPGANAQPLPVELTAEALDNLRSEGHATLDAGGVGVEIFVSSDGLGDFQPISLGTDISSGLGGATSLTPNPERSPEEGLLYPAELMPPLELEMIPEAFEPWLKYDPDGQEPPLTRAELPRTGLQLAILLPWQQLWTLQGFSRGTLLSSIALAPGEETTIAISSWERRAKALEQSAETEVDQQVDFTQTTRDTDDVFRELTSRHDFQWQLHGDLDASYSNGVASIQVGIDGGVSNTDTLGNVLRTTHNHMYEVTNKASTRVRTKRITKITETVELGSSQDVVRRIRNQNECHTLTLDFHEVLAHYRIDTTFLANGVRIVVLVPNPISFQGFSELLVRKNETALHDALLDPALADAFEACRLLKSYEFAKMELCALADEAKVVKELDTERVKDNTATVAKPKNPHEDNVISILKDVADAAKAVRDGQIRPALETIRTHTTVTSQQRTNGQRWMFVRLCQAKIAPAFVNALFALASAVQLGIEDAQRFVDALPGAGAYPSLSNLNDLSDTDKEQAGLDVEIKSQPGYAFWDWGWWTGRCREEYLYRTDDAGLATKTDRLRQAWQDYQAKAAEGEGIEQGNQLTQDAQQEQAQESYLDKLEMKYGADVIASARERIEALLGHLDDHVDYYRYILFQALPPGEQLRRLMDAAPQLQVGMFEPHVVAMNGPYLAVPLSPLGETKLANTLSSLQKMLKISSQEASEAAEAMGDNEVILPTPGVSVESWLGRCSGCEEHLEELRLAEARQAVATARLAELEADRLAARLEASQLDDPSPSEPAVLRVDLHEPPSP
jgi:hypothetical protein